MQADGATFHEWGLPQSFDGDIPESEAIYRFVTSFATTADEVDRFGALIVKADRLFRPHCCSDECRVAERPLPYPVPHGERSTSMTTFSEFMTKREAAASAYVRGDGREVDALSTDAEPASFFGPDGKAVAGADAVKEAYAVGTRPFGPGGNSSFEIVQSAEGGDVGYWAGIQKAVVEMDGKSTPMDLRVTELFRREAGEWKLVHRHADILKQDS